MRKTPCIKVLFGTARLWSHTFIWLSSYCKVEHRNTSIDTKAKMLRLRSQAVAQAYAHALLCDASSLLLCCHPPSSCCYSLDSVYETGISIPRTDMILFRPLYTDRILSCSRTFASPLAGYDIPASSSSVMPTILIPIVSATSP